MALALALGGLTQLLAAMWEFVTGNTYAVTMFGMLSGFYLSAGVSILPQFDLHACDANHPFQTIFWAGSGIEASYEGTTSLTSALGVYVCYIF